MYSFPYVETVFCSISSSLEWGQNVGKLLELHNGCRVLFRVSRGTVGFLSRRCSGEGPHFALRGESRGFPRGLAGSLAFLSNCDGNLKVPLLLPQGSLVSFRVVTGLSGFLTSHCRGNKPNANLCPETPCSSPVVTGISGLHSRSPGESGLLSH